MKLRNLFKRREKPFSTYMHKKQSIKQMIDERKEEIEQLRASRQTGHTTATQG